jgi:predicted MPP superfamily phosphohydrolase
MLARLGWGISSLAAAPVVYGGFVEPFFLNVRRYRLQIADLPAAFDGLRIVHLSDTHYGPFVPLLHLQRAIMASNALSPDLVFLTGDYIQRTRRAIDPGIGAFSGLHARIGVYAVLGNHDHWESESLCRDAFRRISVPLLDNRHLFITQSGVQENASKHPTLCIAGVGDLWEGWVDFEKALRGVPHKQPRLLLSHNPDTAEMVPRSERVDAMFSGHTHGGQMSLPGLGTPFVPSRYGNRYAGGLCKGPAGPVLVSRGVGMSVFPLRFLAPPEISLITLARKL